jgi:hypothetical protein
MARQLIRLDEVRKPDVVDDKQTPQQVAQAAITTETFEQFQNAVLSQLRLLIGQSNWYDLPPQGNITDLFNQAFLAASNVTGEILSGTLNGSNRMFRTQHVFVLNTLHLHFNGVRMQLGADHDFTASESQGTGSGYDTITFVPTLTPRSTDVLSADYVKVT